MIEPTPVAQHRANLKRLVSTLQKKPFDFLPERSVECLNQFFNGYSLFGPPIFRDLSSFQSWLSNRLFYPNDTGAHWSRFIQLNARDRCDGFELFFELYRKYCEVRPLDVHPDSPEFRQSPDSDFFLYLYCINKRPGIYMGAAPYDVQSISAHLAGYFAGKKDARAGLTKDEQVFHRFGDWMCKHKKFTRKYPWHRLVEMWQYRALDSFQCFFEYFNAYLTNFGKNKCGLEDLFETVAANPGTIMRRRKSVSTN